MHCGDNKCCQNILSPVQSMRFLSVFGSLFGYFLVKVLWGAGTFFTFGKYFYNNISVIKDRIQLIAVAGILIYSICF